MIAMDDILISGVTRIANARLKQQGYQVTTNESMVGATLRALAELLAEWLKEGKADEDEPQRDDSSTTDPQPEV